jgi:hypothetical protein
MSGLEKGGSHVSTGAVAVDEDLTQRHRVNIKGVIKKVSLSGIGVKALTVFELR